MQDASGSAWDDSATTGKKPITLPYSIDNDTSTFSTQELDNIVNVWRMVSEDFSAFDVDVTTEFPGESILGNSSSPIIGLRVAIGNDFNDWCADCGGGIAYVDSFGDRYLNPAYVWGRNGGGDAKVIAETASHEGEQGRGREKGRGRGGAGAGEGQEQGRGRGGKGQEQGRGKGRGGQGKAEERQG